MSTGPFKVTNPWQSLVHGTPTPTKLHDFTQGTARVQAKRSESRFAAVLKDSYEQTPTPEAKLASIIKPPKSFA